MTPLTGIVKGSTVVLEFVDEAPLTKAEQEEAWREWARSSRQGPVEDDLIDVPGLES